MSQRKRLAPAGFNALVKRRALELTALLRPHVVPLFLLGEDNAPVFEGSGVLVMHAGVPLVVSAGHVFSALKGNIHMLLTGREERPLTEDSHLTIHSMAGSTTTDKVDLGWVPLTSDEFAAAGSDDFAPMPSVASPPDQWHIR